ncbi:MAG: hypothetical protein ACYTBS_06455 [Planctomycetota bacterium]
MRRQESTTLIVVAPGRTNRSMLAPQKEARIVNVPPVRSEMLMTTSIGNSIDLSNRASPSIFHPMSVSDKERKND